MKHNYTNGREHLLARLSIYVVLRRLAPPTTWMIPSVLCAAYVHWSVYSSLTNVLKYVPNLLPQLCEIKDYLPLFILRHLPHARGTISLTLI